MLQSDLTVILSPQVPFVLPQTVPGVRIVPSISAACRRRRGTMQGLAAWGKSDGSVERGVETQTQAYLNHSESQLSL